MAYFFGFLFILFLLGIGLGVVTIYDIKTTPKMSEKEKEIYDCLDKLSDIRRKGLKTYDDNKKFVELYERYFDIIKTQENEI